MPLLVLRMTDIDFLPRSSFAQPLLSRPTQLAAAQEMGPEQVHESYDQRSKERNELAGFF